MIEICALKNVLTEYETPIWTLIGVVIGFVLSWFYSAYSHRREYRQRVAQAIERIKGGMHLEGSQLGPQRISDLLPQFEEKEQIKILGEVGFESSLNATTDHVTHYILDEFRWRCTLYELFPLHQDIKRSKQDVRYLNSIQSWLWEIGSNVVEYRQSETLLRKIFDLGKILHTYAIAQQYPDFILDQIKLYSYIGKISVGIMYGITGYKTLNFKYGIQRALEQIVDVRDQVQRSKLSHNIREKILAECEVAVGNIKNEQTREDISAEF